ncbi:MAG: iron ABC transporter permease, partial [Clostridia bacterium]|nr:iron ABC transporter permease [Clostridia bacterium]
MLLPCLNTLTQIFTATNASGEVDPLAVIRFFFAGNMPRFVWNSLKLALYLVVTVNVVGVSIVLLTEYFEIKGAKILRLGYMTTLVYSGVALVTGYLFLYDSDGILTTWLLNVFPNMNKNWFTGFNAVLFTMTFACTSNHMLFLRNAIRGIDYNTVEAARNMGAKPFKVLWKVVFPTLIPTMFSLTVMTFITGLCAMSAPTLLGYDSINPEIVRLAGSSIADEAFPQARAALLSIILALFTIILLTILSNYERKGHYLSVSKTKAKLVKQKIDNPVANV